MEVILQEKIRNLGNLGDKVKVAPGYGRNFLIPQGKAVPASDENIAVFEAHRAELEKAAAEHLQKAQSRAATLANLTVTIPAKAGDEGKLFGSLGTRDLATAISAASKLTIEKSEVLLPNGVLRQVGEYEITLQLHSDVSSVVKVVVVPEA